MTVSRILRITIVAGVIHFCLASLCLGQVKATREEYSIYAIVLKSIYKENLAQSGEKTRFVVVSKTLNTDYSQPDDKKMAGLLRSFREKNKTPVILEMKFPFKYQVSLVEKVHLDTILEKDRKDSEAPREPYINQSGQKVTTFCVCCSSSKYFEQSFPKASGYYQFSRIGFSSNGKYAIVEAIGEGACWDSKMTYWMRKSKIGWEIYIASGSHDVA